jgi:hypothetical protein
MCKCGPAVKSWSTGMRVGAPGWRAKAGSGNTDRCPTRPLTPTLSPDDALRATDAFRGGEGDTHELCLTLLGTFPSRGFERVGF